MKKEFFFHYQKQKTAIQARLNQFKYLSPKSQYREFLFCLITPQSNAQKCWQAILELSDLSNPNKKTISNILKTKTRFHNTKTNHILQAKQTYQSILPLLKNPNILQLRNQLSKTVNGYGLKEASHFLRNIGLSNNKIAILDRHILKNLHKHKIIASPKIKTPKHYLEIEQAYLKFAKKLNIPPDELDLLFWSQENGEIFK